MNLWGRQRSQAGIGQTCQQVIRARITAKAGIEESAPIKHIKAGKEIL